MMELTEEQLAESRVPIPYAPVKRLSRDDILYVMEEDIPHPIYGYAKYHKEYSVIDLRGYRKGYEPRLEISGIYTPNPEDTFRLQTGKLPSYQPTTTGDKLLAEMRRLGVHKAFRIGTPTPEEVPVFRLIEEEFVEEKLALRRKQAEKVGVPFDEKRERALLRGEYRIIAPPAVKVEVLPMSVIEYDYRYSLEELREMARQEGLSPSGSKKEIAAKLIARGVK